MNSHEQLGSHARSRAIEFSGPLYLQLAQVLRQKILSLEWGASATMPNEVRLSQEMGVSVGTMRRALKLLEGERLIRRAKGRGTFVVDAAEDSEMDRFSNLYVAERKLRARQSSFFAETQGATALEASKLELRPGEPVHRFKRVMIEPSCAIIHETIAVRASYFPDLAELIKGARILFATYRRHYDVFIDSVAESVSPVAVAGDIAKQLRLTEGQSVLKIERIASATGLGSVEWAVLHVNALNANYRVIHR